MADTVPSYLYKETRLNLESSIPSSTVLLRLPSPGTSSWSSRTAQKRPLPTDVPAAEDESGFKLRHLASAASIYHRQHHKTPRTFLWRVLEDSKVLAIRAVDICKQDKTPDHQLTLRLTFPSPIRTNCIAFADAKEHDVLSVFVLTESNYLYSLTLRPEFFRKRAATEDNAVDWCKTYLPRALGPSHAHRLVSFSAESLLVSLHDGGLLKLDQRAGERGGAWEETHYNEGGWNSLRSLIPFQGNNTVKHGKVNLELAAVTSIAAPATMIDDTPYVFTVSLDHRLRVWNLASRKIAYNGDLLNIEHAPAELGKYVIHPSLSQLVKVYQDVNEKVLAVTYSPAGAGQFKFWGVSAEMDGNLELMDLFPDEVLEPPPPTTDVWTLADFSVDVDKSNSSRLALWVLWKNNLTYRVQKVDFQIDAESARDAWVNEWVSVATETLAETPLPLNLPSDPADPTQKWVEHILYPGRFTTATIETALSLYERGMGGAKNSTLRTSRNLAEKMCTLISSSTTLGRSADGMDYDQFRSAVDAQWRRFYRLVSELDKQRGEALSLSFDPTSQLAWVISSDGLSAIRDCSPIERLWHNPDSVLPERIEAVAALVTAGSAFRDSFSDSLLHACKTLLTAELSQDPSSADAARLRAFYDNCNFGGQITDDDYTQLLSNLGGNFKGVRQEVYEALLGAMTAAEESDQRLERLQLAEVGKKSVIKGVQETIELHQAILFDQVVLLVFIESELDPEEDDIQLDTALIYKQLLVMLRRLELLSWLAKTQISMPLPKAERSNSITEKATSPNKRSDPSQTVTVLEACTSHLLGLIAHTDEPVSSLLTDMLIRVCDPEAEYELQPVIIQAFLLKLDRPDLAAEFSKFCDKDPFSIYIQGRVALATKDLETAAVCFKKAAFGLAHPDARGDNGRHSSGLLDETEWNLLYAGLPRYYSHIVSLFDKDKSYTFVSTFARLGLQFAISGQDPDITPLRTDLHSRLFNASLQTSAFEIAYSTLSVFTDQALRHSSLRTLIFRMCETSNASQLLDFPFFGLQDTVDDILAQKCQGIVDVNVGVPYHKILYAWRIKRNDFRGAAAVSLERLQRLQQSGAGDKVLSQGAVGDDLETPVTRQYLAIINALSCVDPKQAWIISEGLSSKVEKGLGSGGRKESGAAVLEKRKVVTLEDVRRDYQVELDRIAAIGNGQFAFAGGDEMDVF